MKFKEILMQVADDFEMQLDDLCFAVSTNDFDFPFSFCVFEDDEFRGLLVTEEDGMEKLHLIVKSEIVYIRIHYLDELQALFEIRDGNNQTNKKSSCHRKRGKINIEICNSGYHQYAGEFSV